MEMQIADNDFKVVALSNLKITNVWVDGKRTQEIENTYFDCVPLSDPMKNLVKGCKDKVFRIKLPKDFEADIEELSVWKLHGIHEKVYQDWNAPGNPMKVTLTAEEAERIQ